MSSCYWDGKVGNGTVECFCWSRRYSASCQGQEIGRSWYPLEKITIKNKGDTGFGN